MDAKSKADFIKAVATGQGIPCLKCNTLNSIGAKFCKNCGNPLEKNSGSNSSPFEPAKRSVSTGKSEVNAIIEKEDEKSAFAEGLPEWSIEPPQLVVRRKRK